MFVDDLSWRAADGWSAPNAPSRDVALVLCFGDREALAPSARFDELRSLYPAAHILGCSTGGQIRGNEIVDDEIVGVALTFAKTTVRVARAPVAHPSRSRQTGIDIGEALAGGDLVGGFVLSEGLGVNGSELVAGLSGAVGSAIPVTGGLAGDGEHFHETIVLADGPAESGIVGAVGFYGAHVRFVSATAGGWAPFGPRRAITRSDGNVLHELDGKPALDLYARYLGEEDIAGLPGTALHFPLLVRDRENLDREVVRTVLAIDHDERTMTFAGDMPVGWTAQLMRGSFDRLAASAGRAARGTSPGQAEAPTGDRIALLVSCIGRRLLMGEHIVDEVEAAGRALAPDVRRLGYYSNGEIGPHEITGKPELHNQSIIVTTVHEA